jgi:imidazolonepropionase-like amidohydrolase
MRKYIFLIYGIICNTAYSQNFPDSYAISDITIIDAGHPTPLPHQTVLIRGKRIAQIFTDGSNSIPDSIAVFNLKGKYLIPGLIDSHVHLATDPSGDDNAASTLIRLNMMLYSGITSVRDMAGDDRILAGLSRNAMTGEIISPDIYYSALMAGPKFFTDPRSVAGVKGGVPGEMPYMRAITDSTNLILAVAEAKGTGASGIKLYANLPAELVDKIVAEANKQHMRVWAHAWLKPAKPSEVVKAGVGSISHAYLLLYEGMDSIPVAWKINRHTEKFWKDTIPDDAALFKLMKEHKTILDATIVTYKQWSLQDPSAQFSYEVSKMYTAAAFKAGVKICAGTDEGQSFVADEMSLLVKDAGFSPIDALISATKYSAEAIGIENKCGTVEVGKMADLVVLDNNPLDNIENIKSIFIVIKGGKIFKK